MAGALSTDLFRGLGLNKRAEKADPVLGREVTWAEDGRELAGQVWAVCSDGFWEPATHGPGRLYWIAAAGGRTFRVASYDRACGFRVGYWIWDPRGVCVRDGKATA